jgi:hypothetical protein
MMRGAVGPQRGRRVGPRSRCVDLLPPSHSAHSRATRTRTHWELLSRAITPIPVFPLR